MSEVIVVTSGKGGVGKTTTTANIGTGLAKLGKKVVMIDTDTGLRNLDVVLGLENRIVYNLVDVVEGNCRLKQAMIADKRCPNLFLLPTAQTRDKSAVTPEQMIKLTDELREEFDYVLLDCAPIGAAIDAAVIAKHCDGAILVIAQGMASGRLIQTVKKQMEASGVRVLGAVLNKVRMKKSGYEGGYYGGYYGSYYGNYGEHHEKNA